MKTYLELSEVKLLEGAADRPRDRLLIKLLSRSGCRISEVLAMKVSDIDFEQKTITIFHLKRTIRFTCPVCTCRLANRHLFCPECGNRVSEVIKSQQERRRIRVLPVDDNILTFIRDYLKTLPIQDNNTCLFTINRHRAWQIVRDCAGKAGLGPLLNPETGRMRGVSPHRLRDAFSVHAMKIDDSGDGLRLLQEHLGHQSFNTTAKYRKVAGEEHRTWYDGLWTD